MSQESVKKALVNMIEAVGKNPSTAKVVFRAETKLQDDVRCSAKVRDFAVMTVDEPAELGGSDAGMNPVELILVALGTCQEVMFAAYASFMGIKLDVCKVDVKGYLDLRGLLSIDPSVAPGYQQITYKTTIVSTADDSELLKLVDVVERHCPVLDILTRVQSVNGLAVVNGKALHVFNSTEMEIA
jgi:uncharacterized OsmC-like protein